jgi:two-component sensor histidine kinase
MSWIGLCRASQLRPPHEPTVREILSDPIVKALMAADAVDAEVLRAPTVAQAVAVTLHELATNAVKYGALSAAQGQIELHWSHAADGQLILRWTEQGGPAVRVPERKGFGSRLIERTIDQLKGNARFDWRPNGLVCEITFQA